ncbi:MAG: hypothetical protein AAGF82_04595 [Pseudomonadota bacterium]
MGSQNGLPRAGLRQNQGNLGILSGQVAGAEKLACNHVQDAVSSHAFVSWKYVSEPVGLPLAPIATHHDKTMTPEPIGRGNLRDNDRMEAE